MIVSDDEDRARREQAAFWCARPLEDNASPVDRAAFENWLNSDTRNREVFREMWVLWQGIDEIADHPDMIAVRADALNALRNAKVDRSLARRTLPWLAIGAVGICALGFLAAYLLWF